MPSYSTHLWFFPYKKSKRLDFWRHTYATLLAQHGVNMKAISVCMGHYCEDFTKKVYVAHQKIVYDAVEEIQPFIDEVLPKSKNQVLEMVGEKYILEVVPKSAYND